MNQKTTDELMKILSGITNKTDLGNYTDTLSKDDVPDFAGYINDIINDNNLQTADVIRESSSNGITVTRSLTERASHPVIR